MACSLGLLRRNALASPTDAAKQWRRAALDMDLGCTSCHRLAAQRGVQPGVAMSAMTEGRRRGLALIDRLIDALADTARRERTVVVVLLGYVALWTLYGAMAKGSQDIHADMSEQFALGRELALGYPKHPPLAMVVVRAWFSVFPTADWAYYLLAMLNVGLALWIAWRVSARFLDGEKRAIGLALFTLVPFYRCGRQRRCGSCAHSRAGAYSTRRLPGFSPPLRCMANTGR